jgi:hypothetical protein
MEKEEANFIAKIQHDIDAAWKIAEVMRAIDKEFKDKLTEYVDDLPLNWRGVTILKEVDNMKKETEEKPKPEPKAKDSGFQVSDAQQKAGEVGYENDGPFGIGMIKGK